MSEKKLRRRGSPFERYWEAETRSPSLPSSPRSRRILA
jgi:hypothetical protein